MQLTAEHQNKIAQMLSIELSCADEMRLILTQEHEALLNKEPEQIQLITDSKDAIKNRMQKNLLQRDRFLKTLSLPIGNKGTQALVDYFSGSDAEKNWNEFTKLATALKEQNEINGGIVNLSLRHNRAALNIFTGQSTETYTYGPGGQSRKGTFHQTLAKA